jgi:hypothetical protein
VLSLCLSRACLGEKIIDYVYKSEKKDRFLTALASIVAATDGLRSAAAPEASQAASQPARQAGSQPASQPASQIQTIETFG